MERVTFQNWLDAYGRAWESREPQAAAALYSEDGTYQVTPFLKPLRGRQAILEYWTEVARTERDIHFASEILSVTPASGIAHWQASFTIVAQDLRTALDGVFLVTLDAAGRCTSLREWWHKQQ